MGNNRNLRHLDPGDALAEVLFGLIMVLTFTIGARFLMGEEQVNQSKKVFAGREPIAALTEDRSQMYRSILELAAHSAPARLRLSRADFISAALVFVLVSATAIPAIIPVSAEPRPTCTKLELHSSHNKSARTEQYEPSSDSPLAHCIALKPPLLELPLNHRWGTVPGAGISARSKMSQPVDDKGGKNFSRGFGLRAPQ